MKEFTKEAFLETYQIVPVIEYPNEVPKKTKVSVMVITYNHEKYIGQCLEGILMQKTDFDFEVLVGEDDSTDGTREVCIKYAEKNPEKIRLFLHARENNIKLYGIPTGKFNIEYNIYNSKGKYLAICEGDDYWTDPLKLQKQIDFLEANSEYGLIYSDASLIGENTNELGGKKLYDAQRKRQSRIKNLYKSGSIFWELLEKNVVNTLTVCLKKELMMDYFSKFPDEEFAYDHRQWLHVASYSKIKYIEEQWASYRVHNQGISKSNGFFDKRSPLVKQSALIHYMSIINFDRDRINKEVFSKVTYNILLNNNLTRKEKEPIITFFKEHPIFLRYIFNWKLNRLLIRIGSLMSSAKTLTNV